MRHRRYPAKPYPLKRNQTVSSVDVFNIMFPSEWITEHLQPFMNGKIAFQRDATSSMARYCQPITRDEVYIFIICYFNSVIHGSKGRKRDLLCIKEGDQNAMSKDLQSD
jgi:hypothetical protein